MDSGNSGSMQSSSCGDEEFDSRSESISSFFTSSSSSAPSSHVIGALGSSSLNQPPPAPPSLFDPLSTYLDVFARPSSSSMGWPIGLRSEPNCTQPAGPFPPAPSLSTTPQGLPNRTPPFLIPSSSSSSMLPDHQINATTRVAVSSASTSSTDPANIAVGRNPKKRSRASRRAPTTVLTTDTTNFRAMVQEFTGIPAPPFTTSSPFSRSRLDLFGTTASSTIRSGGLDPTTAPPPSYLLRPFAQKLQVPPPPFMSPNTTTTSLSDHTNIFASSSTNTTTTATTTTTSNTSTTNPTVTAVNPNSNSTSNSNYQQLPSELGLLPKQQQPVQNLLSMQDHHHHHPMLSFQSLLQSSAPLKNPSSSSSSLSSSMLSQNNVPIFGMKSSSSSSAQVNLTMNPQVHDELGATELVAAGGLPSLVSSSDHGIISLRSNDNWGSNEYGNSQRVSNSSCKMNFSASSSSDFLADNKGSENAVRSRGEGMVDSWICPSD